MNIIKMKILYLCLLFFLLLSNNVRGQEFTLTIKIANSLNKAPLEFANIYIDPCSCGGVSDRNGEFSIRLPKNIYEFQISYIGFKEHSQKLVLDKNTIINVLLDENQETISEVVVKAKSTNDHLESPEIGVLQLNTEELKKIPAALGEYDVLRGVTLMAGVNNAGEVSNGISVRGGSLDQNLLLYDHAPVFNPTHLFGIFSVFTPDAISSVDIYRGYVPPRYGGRSTSVVDIKVKNPFVDEFKLSGGVGLVSSRLKIETPIIKDKLMIVASVRAGLTDFLLPIFSERLKNIKTEFYDGTTKLLYLPTTKDQLTFTGFYSKDFYQLDQITKVENINTEVNQYDFETFNNTFNWLHSFNGKTNLRTIFVSSNYTAKNIFPELIGANEIEYRSNINYNSLISELSYNISSKIDFNIGSQFNKYDVKPGDLNPGTSTSILPVSLLEENSYELSGYSTFNWKPLDFISISGGLRYNYFVFQGPYTLNSYDESGITIIGTEFIQKGKKVKSYDNFEPRLGASLVVNKSTSFKASYSNANQYLQNIYNSTTPLPTSRWKTSDSFIKPQSSHSYGIGVFKTINDDLYEISVEGYYRSSENNLTYKPGADFFLEQSVEQSLTQVEGKAYGVEVSLKKKGNRINGLLNYTWSRSLLRSDGKNLTDRINNNNWFRSDFDKPHVINANISVIADKYNTINLSFTGQTGRPYTIPNGIFELQGIDVPIFLERNNARLPSYHHLDFSWNVAYNKRENPRWVGDWTFTIYNLYGRRNAYSRFFTQRDGNIDKDFFGGYALGEFQVVVASTPIFALTYNFIFQ